MTVSQYHSIAAMSYMPMVPEHASLSLRHDPIQKLLINHLNNSYFGIDSLLALLC